jgi:hypothetical protein
VNYGVERRLAQAAVLSRYWCNYITIAHACNPIYSKAEMRKNIVTGQPWQNISENLSQPTTSKWWQKSVIPAVWDTVGRKAVI